MMVAVSLADAKALLRIEHDDEDALLTRLIATAADYCERFTGQVLITRPLTETIAATGNWRRLRAVPVRAITAVERIAPDGTVTALPLASHAIDIDADGGGWVRVTPGEGISRARVTFTAGLADDAATLPAPLGQGILRLVAHLYTHRDAADETGPPMAVVALWRPWRRIRLR